MSYNNPALATRTAITRLHELYFTSAQTVSAGDVLKFDSIRSTSSGGGIAYNSSTGVFTTSDQHRYFFHFSLDVTRNNKSDDVRVAFFDSDTNTEINISEGHYDATFGWHHETTTHNALPNATMQAQYIPLKNAKNVYLKIFDIGNNSSINTNCSMIIIEADL
tara:strand:- start:10742 stop:11230 length:489 start_codon:yes stop_codon:yes gene_type:complete